MLTNPYPIIDADGHVMEILEPAIRWEDWLEEPYKARAPKIIPFDTGGGRVFMEGKIWSAPYAVPRNVNGKDPYDVHLERKGMYNPQVRLEHLDAESIDTAVLIGGTICLGVPGLQDAGYARAVARAYNNWLADFCHANPKRLKGTPSMPLQDPPAAAAELHRTVSELGFVAACVPTNVGGKNLYDPLYWPTYEEAERLGVPVLVHTIPQMHGIDTLPSHRFNKQYFVVMMTNPIEQMLAVASVCSEGVLDRFTKLKFAFLEGWCGWLPFWLQRMDEHYEMMGRQVASKAKPSDYWKSDQLFISCDPDEEEMPHVVDVIGAQRILYASDYWHYDGRFPNSARMIQRNPKLSDEAKRLILSDNALRLFGERILA